MKAKLIYALSALVMITTMLVTSCKKSDAVDPNAPITIPTEFTNILLESDEVNQEVTFTATTDWSITLEETTKATPSWLKVSPMSGKAGDVTLKIGVKQNTVEKERSSLVKINAGGKPYSITVNQKAGNHAKQESKISINDTTKPFTGVAKIILDSDPDVSTIFAFSGVRPQANVEDGNMMGHFGPETKWCGYIRATNMTNVDITQAPGHNDMFMLMLVGEDCMYRIYYGIAKKSTPGDLDYFEAYYSGVLGNKELTIESGTISYNLNGDKVAINLNLKLSEENTIEIIYDGDVPDMYVPVYVEEIKLDKKEITLKEGETAKFTVTEILPTNADNKELVWESMQEDIATVDQDGNIKALKAGTVYIRVSSKDGNTFENCVVKVEAADDASVVVTFDANGGKGTMTAQKFEKMQQVALNPNSFTRENYTFSGWNTTSDGTGTSYADQAKVTLSTDVTLYAKWTKNEVAPTGLFLADIDADNIPEGDEWSVEDSDITDEDRDKFAGLKAALESLDASRTISLVFPNLDTIPQFAFYSFDPSAKWSVSAPNAAVVGINAFNQTNNLTAIDLPKGGELGGYILSSCSDLINLTIAESARIESSGIMTFSDAPIENIDLITHSSNVVGGVYLLLADGTTKVGPFKSVNGVKPSAKPTSVVLNRSTATVPQGKSVQLVATVLPEGVIDNSVYWRSSNTTFATVDKNGLVTLKPYCPAGKTTRITAYSLLDDTKFAYCDVTMGVEDVLTLATIDPDNLPSSDTWVFEDHTGDANKESQFANLRAAMKNVAVGRSVNIVFPNLTSIPSDAFKSIDSGSFKITAPEVVLIGSRTFYMTNNLAIDIPKLRTIGGETFYKSGLSGEYTFENVVSAGMNAFCDCDKITKLCLPNVETVIAGFACSCDELTELYLPKLAEVSEFDGSTAIMAYCNKLTKLTIATTGRVEFGRHTFMHIPSDQINIVTHADNIYYNETENGTYNGISCEKKGYYYITKYGFADPFKSATTL